MKKIYTFASLFLIAVCMIACSKVIYNTNGESIYNTGKTLEGKKLLDRKHSQITIFKSCRGCHGPSGARTSNIKWSYLSNSEKIAVPYTEELFFRFLDKDIKSDGTPARTGVHWNMTLQEKKDMLEFLRTL